MWRKGVQPSSLRHWLVRPRCRRLRRPRRSKLLAYRGLAHSTQISAPKKFAALHDDINGGAKYDYCAGAYSERVAGIRHAGKRDREFRYGGNEKGRRTFCVRFHDSMILSTKEAVVAIRAEIIYCERVIESTALVLNGTMQAAVAPQPTITILFGPDPLALQPASLLPRVQISMPIDRTGGRNETRPQGKAFPPNIFCYRLAITFRRMARVSSR
jgi:hypothetical protein